ncbi:hypothetical protein C8J56DRAFT_932540 [Mycena floridula]|nr:hypothetical protein C8J56DRAFT_932540 [Mycena floridula]
MRLLAFTPVILALLASAAVIPSMGDSQSRVSRDLADVAELQARGAAMSRLTTPKDPDRKAKYRTGNPRPETPKGEFRQHTAGHKDDYFGDWKTQTKGVHNPAAGKGKYKRDEIVEIEARGAALSRLTTPKDPDRKAKYHTGSPRPETPKGEFRQHTAGRKDDYFGDWKTQTKGVHNPAAGKGKYKRDEIVEIEARGAAMSRLTTPKDPDRKAKYPTGNPRPETPKGEFRQHTAGRKDDYFGDWKTQTKGIHNPAAGKGKY